jgi:hypothetical protein
LTGGLPPPFIPFGFVALFMHVALQLFSYDEDYDRLWGTMDAYAEQTLPDSVDRVDYMCCLTPAITARHVGAAQRHPTFEFFETPSGKLSSRNVAHDEAVSRGADVIVTTDADAPPLSDGTLSRLLEPYGSRETVATNANPVSPGLIGVANNITSGIEDIIRPHMHGQLSSFTAGAWESVGPFDTDIDQTDIHQVRGVEEFQFYRDLSQLGEVMYCPEARVTNDTRRVKCYLDSVQPGEPKHGFCKRAGNTTFQPKNEDS